MSAKDRSAKDKVMAAFLKKRGVERKTGMCPWGCGKPIANGGGPLLNHLVRCHGNRKQDKRTRVRVEQA